MLPRALLWIREGFMRQAHMVRDIRAVKRHIALVFVAFTILQLCSRDRRFKDLVAGAVSIGAQIRKVTTEAVGMFIVWVSKQVHAGASPETILDFTFRSKAAVAAM